MHAKRRFKSQKQKTRQNATLRKGKVSTFTKTKVSKTKNQQKTKAETPKTSKSQRSQLNQQTIIVIRQGAPKMY